MPSFRCEHCRQKIAARDAYAGRRVRCPRCKQGVRVPAVEAPPMAAPPPKAGAANVKVDVPTGASVPMPEPAPVFTQPPPRDFSSIFSAPLDELFEGGPNDYAPEEQTQVLRPVHPPIEPPSDVDAVEFSDSDLSEFEAAPKPPPVVVEPAEIIDAPAPMRSGLNSVNEVADLLRGLDNPSQRARLAASSAAVDAEARRQILASSRPIRVLGWMSLVVGLASVGLGCYPAFVRFAIPTGAGGMLLAITGLVLAAARRAKIALPAGGACACAAGVGVALLWAFGLVPWSDQSAARHAAGTPPVTLVADTQSAEQTPAQGDYVPASSPLVLNHVQVRVVSALVLRPAVYAGTVDSLHTADERRFQITLELKNLSDARAVYVPWRRNNEGDRFVQLTGPNGVVLPLDESAAKDAARPVLLAAAAMPGPKVLGARPEFDVLLFDPPASVAGDFLLDLPGRNIGQPGVTLHIRIPASMIGVQGM